MPNIIEVSWSILIWNMQTDRQNDGHISIKILYYTIYNNNSLTVISCRAISQAVRRWPLTAEARFRARVSPRENCDGLSDTGRGFSPRFSNFPCQYHSTMFLHTHTSSWVNNRPVGGRSSQTWSHPITMNNSTNKSDVVLIRNSFNTRSGLVRKESKSMK
jgi:hypothetical protein